MLWHSVTECTNSLYVHDLIVPLMPLYHVKFWEDWYSSFGGEQPNKNCIATQLQFDDRRPFVMLVFEINWNIGILI